MMSFTEKVGFLPYITDGCQKKKKTFHILSSYFVFSFFNKSVRLGKIYLLVKQVAATGLKSVIILMIGFDQNNLSHKFFLINSVLYLYICL